ncbi:hypothetical protein EQV77_15815 [Halobacillus fulvus]|nr:hypothetical protein EQV77_15815 [Halobacillus fulvus]
MNKDLKWLLRCPQDDAVSNGGSLGIMCVGWRVKFVKKPVIVVSLWAVATVLFVLGMEGGERSSADADGVVLPSSTVSPYHTWEITINSDVAPGSIDESSVYVTNEQGQKVSGLSLEVIQNKIAILPPEEGYELDGTYRIHVSEDVRAADDTFLQEQTSKTFQVNNEEPDLQASSMSHQHLDSLFIKGKEFELIHFLGDRYVPLKAVVDAHGDRYQFNEQWKRVTVTTDQGEAVFNVDKPVALSVKDELIPISTKTNGELTAPMGNTPIVRNGEVYVPLESVETVLGYTIERTDHSVMIES